MDNTKLKSRLATKAQALQENPAEREPASLVLLKAAMPPSMAIPWI